MNRQHAPSPSAAEIAGILDSAEIATLIADLDALRRTGRKGYGARPLVGAFLVKSLYTIPTWTRVAALIADHAALRAALGDAPSQWACYRFVRKLREHKRVLDACIDRIIASLREQLPEYGHDIAIDASDVDAYANGQRTVSRNGPLRKHFADLDASWGHRSAISTRKGGGFYGYKVHLAVCARTDLPIAWFVRTGKTHEARVAIELLDMVCRRVTPESVAFDKGYDGGAIYDACERVGAVPIIPLRETLAKKNGWDAPPKCIHGEWTFAGADFKNRRAKWRCPTGECTPASMWRKASRKHPIIPRHSKRWKSLYAGRASVERAFGRLKHDYGLRLLRTRGIERAGLHADLCVLAQLARALSRARGAPPPA